MRILASADVHGNRPVYDWLLNVAQQQEVDAIVLAGDLFGCLEASTRLKMHNGTKQAG